MARKSVPAVFGAEIALWVPALCLVVFLIAHFTLFGLAETLGEETFLLYSKIAEVVTHLFALFAILEKNVEGLREQIVLSTVISVVFHAVENFQGNEIAKPWHTLDRAAATGLIVSVFVKFLVHVHHSELLLILSVGLACAFPWGNLLASTIVTFILLCVLLLKKSERQPVQSFLKNVVTLLSFGGTPSDPTTIVFSKKQGDLLVLALVVDFLAVAAYVVGEVVSGLEHWAHTMWHAFVYVTLWLVVKVLEDALGTKEKGAGTPTRKDRDEFVSLLPRTREWLLAF